MRTTWILVVVSLLLVPGVRAQEEPMRPDHRFVPGEPPTPWLRYRNPAARRVEVCGTWDQWSVRRPMTLKEGAWTLDTRALPVTFGYYEFKFIADGEWEPGDNRALYFNGERWLDKPSDAIFDATIEGRDEILVRFRRGIPEGASLSVSLQPGTPVREWRLATARESGGVQGYFIAGSMITFVFEPAAYEFSAEAGDRVVVAGNFTGWDGNGGGGRWALSRTAAGTFELTTQMAGLRAPPGEQDLLFKFVVNGRFWLPPPKDALNAVSDGRGNANLRVEPALSGGTSLRVKTDAPLDLSVPRAVIIEGLGPRPLWRMLTPGGVFDALVSEKALGAILDRENGCTHYRLFAPRATAVELQLYDGPYFEVSKPKYQRVEPVERYPLWKDEADGVWEVSLFGLDIGRYYTFSVAGPSGPGESFNPHSVLGDPYARAAAHAENNSLVIDPEATNQWFGGWTDGAWKTPAPKDTVIYEMHVRDFTMHPSSGVPAPLRGKYEGILATAGAGTGLDHLKDMGVNTVELMPVNEFNNGPHDYSWGYSTAYFFAPEASYARAPLKGSQYYEFKRLVDGLHGHGFSVLLDVVYNHIGWPNVFSLIDKKYFFRLNPDFTYSNYSGCGNDVRTESPMMRRLIVDNVLYWMKEHRVDGFRFDLAELIDMDTMRAIEAAARAARPDVLLISEPWSLRGDQKRQLRGTTWAAWNNDFRYAAKDFALARGNRDWLQKKILGSSETWAAHPMQSINYLESHDDMSLADEFCLRPDRDGRHLNELDVAPNRLAATILFTSLGIPMINAGQEFLRSKRGISNTYNRGDDVNALRWTDRDRPLAVEAMAYYRGLIRLRQSPEGAAFRVSAPPPPGYYQWLTPPPSQALGYIINAPKRHDGAGFIVLLNAGNEPASFSVPFPEGRWRLIGNGKALDPAGLPDTTVIQGGFTLSVQAPPVRALIYMNGF